VITTVQPSVPIALSISPLGKSSESVQCAITGRCLCMRHRLPT